MPVTYSLQSMIDSACFIAQNDGINKDMVAEIMVPVVFQQVAREWAASDLKRPYIMAVLALNFTNGVATLSDQVIVEALRYGVLANALDATQTKKFTFIASWADFTRPLTPTSLQLGYFAVLSDMTGDNDANIYVVLPGATYSPGTGFTGNLTLSAPIVPAVPTVASNPVQAPLEFQQDCVLRLSQMIAGGWAKEIAA
jgi:hypothetical protein